MTEAPTMPLPGGRGCVSLTPPRVGKLCSHLCSSSPRGKAPPHYSETPDRLRASGGTREACRILRSPHPVASYHGNTYSHNSVLSDLSPKVLVPLAFPPHPRSHVWTVNLPLPQSPYRVLSPQASPPGSQSTGQPAQPRLSRQGPSSPGGRAVGRVLAPSPGPRQVSGSSRECRAVRTRVPSPATATW